MTSFRIKDLDRILPDLEELRGLRGALLRKSSPDPERAWSGSGELQTSGDRLVDLQGMAAEAEQLLEQEISHLRRLDEKVRAAITCASEGNREGAARALLAAASVEESRGRFRRAGAYAEAAHSVASELRDQALAGLALRRQGRFERFLGKGEDALQHYREAFEIGAAVGDAQGTAEAAIGAGNVLEQEGRWMDAANWYRRALDTLEEAKEPGPERWHASLNLHIVERSLGQVDESEGWIEAAEAIAESLGDESARFFFDHARAQLHMARGEFEAAGARFLEALVRAPAAYTPTVRLNLAESLLARRLLLDAAEEARIAEAEVISGGTHRVLPHVYRTLGRCAVAMDNPDAFVLFERSLEAPESGGTNRLERAKTLQNYALAMHRFDRGSEAAELMDEAARAYRGLGVEHFRRPWVDCFDVGSTEMNGSDALNFFHERGNDEYAE